MAVDTFRILHLSDLHLAECPSQVGVLDSILDGKPDEAPLAIVSSYNRKKLNGIALLVRYELRDLDAILITGDLATTGKMGDLATALKFVDGQPVGSSWFTCTGGVTFPTIHTRDAQIGLLPGNHDRFHYPGGLFPGNRRFNQVFHKFWSSNQRTQPIIDLLGRSQHNRLSIISVDCSLESLAEATSPFGHFGQGKVHRQTIVDLRNVTQRTRQSHPSTAIVWALHFPPKPPKSKRLRNLIDDDELLKEAQSCQVSCILCGHFHETNQYKPVDYSDVWIGVAGTACQAGNCVGETSLYEICVDDGTILGNPKVSVYQWDDTAGRFVEIHRRGD